MLADERQARIVSEVDRRGTVTTADLIEVFGVSPITIRRDLNDLAEKGLIIKVHGGARSVQTNSNPAFEIKASTNRAAKEAIAAATKELVKDGESLMISTGTTCAAIAAQLSTKQNLTVVTNGAPIADAFSTDTEVYLTGGRRTENHALVGPLATASISQFHAKTLITSVHAADSAGFTTPSPEEAETIKAMFAACERVILALDHSKWGVQALANLGSWQQVDTVVVDSEMPSEAINELKELVDKVVVAS